MDDSDIHRLRKLAGLDFDDDKITSRKAEFFHKPTPVDPGPDGLPQPVQRMQIDFTKFKKYTKAAKKIGKVILFFGSIITLSALLYFTFSIGLTL